MGMVYLIHFDEPLHHAKHYLGFCEDGNLDARMERHRSGGGSKLLAALKRKGIGWKLVRVWEDQDRNFERSLKNKKCTPRMCPVCNPKVFGEQHYVKDLVLGTKCVDKLEEVNG